VDRPKLSTSLVDGASLGAFRIGFGIACAWHVAALVSSGEVVGEYAREAFHAKYPGFEWVKPLPLPWSFVHFGTLVVAAACVALGWYFRLACGVFTIGYTALFLFDRSAYQNHCYLLCLLSFLLFLSPADRALSVAGREPRQIAALWIYILRFQLAVVYIYGGIAKLNVDWLIHAQPMTLWIAERGLPHASMIGRLTSWVGVVFDLLVVPALLSRTWRMPALIASLLFHVTNAMLFKIGVFPWLMLWANLLFLPTDWPRAVLDGVSRRRPNASVAARMPLNPTVVGAVFVYVALQLLMPLRHYAYAGDASWTEEGHDFAWRMKLRDKRGDVGFAVYDPAVRAFVAYAEPRTGLTARQWSNVVHDPEAVRQLAHAISARLPGRPAVRALTSVSMNGRPRQPLVTPTVDLSREPFSWGSAAWIEPLRTEADGGAVAERGAGARPLGRAR
jgi:vitamin K-dependent gamma-carboxylase